MIAEQLGAAQFRAEMKEKRSPYSILMADSTVEQLASALTHRFKVEDWQKNVERQGTLADLPGVPIVKFKDNPWAIAFWSMDRYINLKRDSRHFSNRMKSDMIQLWETDATGWIEWLVWREGEEREGCERMGDDDAYLRSNLRKVPDLDDLEGDILRERLASLVDELLMEQEAEIPALNLDLSNPRIERVDVLVLPSHPLGMSDFQKCIHEGHPEYAIFAVKAPIEVVSPAIAQYAKATDWQKDIHAAGSIWSVCSVEDEYWMPIIQPENNDWTVVYWCVGDWVNLSKIVTNLSEQLKTKVMCLGEEDTSGAVGYELFDQGKQVERMEYADEMYFESELIDEPEFEDFEEDERDTMDQFINDRFIEEGIYIPAWDLEASDPWLRRIDLMPPQF